MAILKKYTNSLRNYGWSEEQILADLEGEAYELATSTKNWSDWRNQMEAWIKSIQSWEKESIPSAPKDLSLEDIKNRFENCLWEIQQFIEVMIFLQRPVINRGDSVVAETIINIIKEYISDQVEAIQSNDGSIDKLKPTFVVASEYGLHFITSNGENSLHIGIENLCDFYYTPLWLSNVYLPNLRIETPKDAALFKNMLFEEMGHLSFTKKTSSYNPRL